MGSESHGRRKRRRGAAAKPPSGRQQPAAAASGTQLGVRRREDGAWELVPPRCARERAEDLEEVRGMLEAGETEIARDECRWLLEGCSDCLDAHRILGEIALEENDLALARGHFGYAFRLGTEALRRAKISGPLPYRLVGNQSFLESAKALAWCLLQLDKREMAEEVVELALACDPSDPLALGAFLSGDASGE